MTDAAEPEKELTMEDYAMRDDWQMIEKLLERGVNPDRCHWEKSALFWAIHSNARKAFRVLIEKGKADIHLGNLFDENAMHFAAQAGSAIFVRSLYLLGGDINYRSRLGHTPLRFAVLYGKLWSADALCSFGADPYEGSPNVIEFAREEKQFEIAEHLESHIWFKIRFEHCAKLYGSARLKREAVPGKVLADLRAVILEQYPRTRKFDWNFVAVDGSIITDETIHRLGIDVGPEGVLLRKRPRTEAVGSGSSDAPAPGADGEEPPKLLPGEVPGVGITAVEALEGP